MLITRTFLTKWTLVSTTMKMYLLTLEILEIATNMKCQKLLRICEGVLWRHHKVSVKIHSLSKQFCAWILFS